MQTRTRKEERRRSHASSKAAPRTAEAVKKPSPTKSRSKRRSPGGAEPKALGDRAIWSGAIAFGLVQIPVKVTTAEVSNELSFHQVDRRDLSPIGYERINKETGEKVEWDDIAKSYEITKGQLVLVEDEDFEKANAPVTHTIDIQDFVELAEIPTRYFERPYFLVPETHGKKAYGVLRDVLAKKGLVAIALVVLRTRQHLAAIVPEGKGLLLELLRFDDELKPTRSLAATIGKEPEANAKEVAMAERLVDELAAKWDPARYHDTYKETLLEALAHKAKTGKMPASPKVKPATRGATDLVALLRKSVASAAKRGEAPAKKKPPSARKKASAG